MYPKAEVIKLNSSSDESKFWEFSNSFFSLDEHNTNDNDIIVAGFKVKEVDDEKIGRQGTVKIPPEIGSSLWQKNSPTLGMSFKENTCFRPLPTEGLCGRLKGDLDDEVLDDDIGDDALFESQLMQWTKSDAQISVIFLYWIECRIWKSKGENEFEIELDLE